MSKVVFVTCALAASYAIAFIVGASVAFLLDRVFDAFEQGGEDE